jgi:hypothetical protein
MRPVNCYATDHQHSRVICQAFAQGCGGKVVPVGRLLEGPAMVYGILRGCGDILHQCEWIGRPWYHMDNGYFRRGHYEGYYRVTKGGLQYARIDKTATPHRFEALKVPVKPWNRGGNHIVITPLSGGMASHWLPPGLDERRWLELVVEELARHTDRPIVVKDKGTGSIEEALTGAWCLVTHSSVSVIDALCRGVPVIHLGESCAAPVARSRLADVESPVYPEREPWLWTLADRQWTLDEIRRGEAWDVFQ